MASADLFLSDLNQFSLRGAIVEDDGETGYLYLTEPGSSRIAAAAWIYNRGSISDPVRVDWTIIWGNRGDSVAVLADGLALACIIDAGNPGFSRGLVADAGVGHVWDENRFAHAFGRV
jgi:hypothetical protein